MPTRSVMHNVKPASPAAGRARAFLLRLDRAAADTTTDYSPSESHRYLCHENDTAATPCGPLNRVMRAEPPALRAQTKLTHHAVGQGRMLYFGEDGAQLH